MFPGSGARVVGTCCSRMSGSRSPSKEWGRLSGDCGRGRRASRGRWSWRPKQGRQDATTATVEPNIRSDEIPKRFSIRYQSSPHPSPTPRTTINCKNCGYDFKSAKPIFHSAIFPIRSDAQSQMQEMICPGMGIVDLLPSV